VHEKTTINWAQDDLQIFPALSKSINWGRLLPPEALNMLRQETSLEWSVLSRFADLYSGQRPGQFRLGTDQLLRDANGKSRISLEDFVMALIDEVEKP
jgi:uncharacterized protein